MHNFTEIEKLQLAWDRGKSSGIAGPLDMKAIIAEERAKFAEASQKKFLNQKQPG